MPLDPPAALPDDSARASLEKAMQDAEKTSAKVAGKLKSAAVTGTKVAGVGAAVVAAPVAVVTAPVWAPAALLATPVVYEGGKLVGGGAAKAGEWALGKLERANAKQEEKANQRFAVQNSEMISALSQPLPGGLTTNPAVCNLLADHIKGSATQMSPDEAVQMAAIGEHIYKALSDGKKAGPNGLEVNVPGRDSPLLVPPGNFAAKAVSWHIMASAAQSNLDRQNLPGAKRDDMTNSGTFILKDPGNNVYNFLKANPMVMQRMSSHYEERLDHDKKVPILGNTLQKGCDDYQNKFPGGGGALLFDKMKGGEIFVKFEHAGTPKPIAAEGHDTKKHTAMRSALAANRWVEHSFSFLESLKAGGGDPNKVVRQEDIHKGEMKAAVYDPYVATLKAATAAGIITKREAEAMKSHARCNGLPSVTGGLDILKERQQAAGDSLDPAKSASFTLAAQVLEKNIDYKLQSMGQGNNDLGIQRRGGEVHLSADPNKYLPAQGPAQQVDSFDPPAAMNTGFTLHENTDKTNAQASESYSMRSDEGQVLGAKGETRAFAKPQLDASAFPGLKAQEEAITQGMKALAKDSDGLSQWSQKKNQIKGIDGAIGQAEKDLANSVAGLARANASGNEQQKATWQNNVDVDQAKLDQLLDLKSRPDELAAELDQLSQHPDVVSFKQMSDQLDEVKRQLAPMESVAKASSALYKNMMDMNEDASLGGDRALLARSVATFQVDQLLGTNVIAEEKMAVTPEGRLMGVSVQADGAQVTGKHEEKDCFLKTDYSDPRIQKGMADLEAVDYITGQIDRHNGNIFVHPECGKVTGIDNDLAFPEHKRADVIASDPGLGEKAVKTMPRLMSQETADKILATKPEQLADLLKGMQNPDGAGGLSPAEIQGAVDRLQELQNAIKDPASGVQVVKEFNQQTYETSIQQQRDLLAEQTGLDDFKQPAADFKDVDNASLMTGAHKASYLGAAVMVGQKYELLQGQSADGVEFGIRDGKTANVTARVDPEFAEYKKQEQAARQSLAANPLQIENPNVKRDVLQLQGRIGQLQQQLGDCQQQLDKLDGPQSLLKRAGATLHIGKSTDEKREKLGEQKQEILQNIKQAQAGLDKALDKAVQPLQADLRMNAQEKVAEKNLIAQQKVDDRAVKLEALRQLAQENGIDPKMVELGGLGDREPSLKKMLDVAVNKDINAASFRERAGEMQAKSPAEAVLANMKGDRDESIGKAIRNAVAVLNEGGPDISQDQLVKLTNTFDAARQQCDRHDQEEKVQNGQRLELYQKEVTDAVTPLLEARQFTPQEIAVFAEAAVKLGMEAESAALKNNAANAKMYADQLKDGLQNCPFKYSDHNPEASKLHDAIYSANNTNAHLHADGDVEIKRGHASFQEKTANRILADVAALKGVALDPVKAAQMLEVHAPKAENSVAGMLGRHRPNAPLPAQDAIKAAEGQEGGKVDVRASLGIQRAPKPPGVGQSEVEKPEAGKVGAKWQPAKPKEGQGGPAAKSLGKTV